MRPRRIPTGTGLVMGALLVAFAAPAQEPSSAHDRFEMRFFGGGLPAGSMVDAQPAYTAGVEGAIRLTHVVAVTGSYAYEDQGGCGEPLLTEQQPHEASGP